MGKFGIGVVILGLVAFCSGDKDPTLSLRPPSSSSPVFSSSIDSVPGVNSAGTNQQNVYAKRPNSIHSSSLTSGSGIASSSGDAGRNNNPWYNQGGGFSFGFNGGDASSASSASSHASASASTGGGYFEHPPPIAPTPSSQEPSVGATQGPSYAYYYQHYPNSPGAGHGWSAGGGDDSGHGGILGDLALPGFQFPGLGAGGGGLAGIGGVGAVKALTAIGKGILVVKPFLILGLLILIAIPVLLLLLPLPIITITGQPGGRSARSSQIATYLTQLSGKVLNSEECLERIICKLPQAPEKYQTRAKLVWDEYGTKMVSNERVSRGLNAYFESSTQKNKNLKCNQRFKCSNKYL